jgi:hypothetical protein
VPLVEVGKENALLSHDQRVGFLLCKTSVHYARASLVYLHKTLFFRFATLQNFFVFLLLVTTWVQNRPFELVQSSNHESEKLSKE